MLMGEVCQKESLKGERENEWEREREREKEREMIWEQSGQNSPLCAPATIHQMSNLQKYMRAKKETANCISESIFDGEAQSIMLKAMYNDKSHHLRRMTCPTHRCQMKSVKSCECALVNLCSHTFVVGFLSSGCHEMLPWWQVWHVDKIANINLEENALFHQHKPQLQILQLALFLQQPNPKCPSAKH